jgi:thioredoxin 1
MDFPFPGSHRKDGTMKGNTIVFLALLAVAAALGWNTWREITSPEEDATHARRLKLMDFSAEWCPPCRAMKPVVHELAEELRGQLEVVEIDVDQNPDLAQRYNITRIPCFILTRDGKEVNRQTGSMPKENLRELTGL